MAAMAKKPPKPRAKPVGEPLDWTDAEIDELAKITPDDIRLAGVDWRRKAPKRARKLLDAKEADDDGQ